jgi:hypothetical protein
MWAKEAEDDMEEDETDESKKRSVQGLIDQDGTSGKDGAIIPVDKPNSVANIMSQFEPLAPPSPGQVRDPKRKKTIEDDVSDAKSKNGALAGSLEGHRQAQ